MVHIVSALAFSISLSLAATTTTTSSLSTKCSLNGLLDGNTCSCIPGWKGEKCSVLNLAPVPSTTTTTPPPGFRETNTSSWGGSIIQDKDDPSLYHMFVSRFSNHCGLDAWQSNSEIIHATTANLSTPFKYASTIFPVFAHNPLITFSPSDDTYVLFYEMASPPPCGYTTCACTNGTTTDECIAMNDFDCPTELQNWPSYISTSKSLNGPWSDPQQIPAFKTGGDFNLSPVINDDGSLYGLWRDGIGDPWVSHLRSFTATSYKDVNSYVKNMTDIFPDLDVAAIEDPHLYRDNDGNYHAIFHDMQNECRHLGVADGTGACGGHGYSTDGYDWRYSSDPLTYDGYVEHEGGGEGDDVFTRRERPHLVFDEDNNIVALSTAVMFGERDESYTHLQFVVD